MKQFRNDLLVRLGANLRRWSGLLVVYLKAYGRHLFRSALLVTVICVLLFLVLLFVPQAAELVLSQATFPESTEGAAGFYWRLFFMNLAGLVLAFSIWLSARLLIESEWKTRGWRPESGSFSGYRSVPAGSSVEAEADTRAAVYAPRVLGASVFFTLQIAAARSISEQSYFAPIGLVVVWLAVLAAGLLRATGRSGSGLRPWWLLFLGCAAIYAVGATANDLRWVLERVAPEGWKSVERSSLYFMGGGALATCLVLMAATPWLIRRDGVWWPQAVASGGALLAVLASFLKAGELEPGERYGLFFVCQSLGAFLFWCLVVMRRHALARMVRAARRSATAARFLRFSHRHPHAFVAAVVCGLTALLVVWAGLDPFSMGGYMGAVGIVLAFVAFLVLAVASVQTLFDRSPVLRSAIPGGMVAVALLALLFVVPTAPQDPPPAAIPGGQAPHLQAHLAQLPAEGPLFAVAAHGGGIRAALYTASFAAWMDHYTAQEFSRRLLVGSGASGGSLGLAVWSAVHAAGCGRKDVIDEKDTPVPRCAQVVKHVLTQDHLAPLLATGLFQDYILLWGPPARGNTLQESVLSAAARLGDKVLPGVDRALSHPLPTARYPLLLNTSTIGSAMPYALASRAGMLPTAGPEPHHYRTYVDSTASNELSLLSAAMHSARFPLISPKAKVTSDRGPAVVDGGYFDNSGVAVLRQHILALDSHHGMPMASLKQRVVTISLDSDPIAAKPSPLFDAERDSVDEILGTILAARAAHGRAAWHQLCTELNQFSMYSLRPGAPLGRGCNWRTEEDVDDGTPLWQVQLRPQGPALGWYLSPRSARQVMEHAQAKAYQLALFLGYAHGMDPPRGAAVPGLLPMP